MQNAGSLDEYYGIINQAKARCGKLKTNCMLFPEAIERYIRLNRFYAEEVEAGAVFYTDEETFYQAYYYINPDIPFTVSRKKLPVLIQNVYKGEKKPWLLSIESSLVRSGFQLKDTMMHGVFINYEGIPRILRTVQVAERTFRNAGLTFAPLKREQIPEMKAFRKTIKEIPFYQIPFFTDDELMEEAEAERLCCVTDRNGKMIAARHLIVDGQKAYGWVGIEEEYKMLYGVALIFLGHALGLIQKDNIKMCSWVDTKNTASYQYHERLGTEWTGHMEDEWLME